MIRSRFAGIGFLAAMVVGCAPGAETSRRAPVPAPTPAPPAGGLYTEAQAERGQAVFDGVCAACHGNNEFRGRMFERTWMAEPIGYLYQHISTAMPQDNPGSLSPEQYAAVVAYLMKVNGRPAGDRELPADPEALRELSW
jgi:S-disulfanyl-L-cysteine oxidoreductase SoxD